MKFVNKNVNTSFGFNPPGMSVLQNESNILVVFILKEGIN